MSMKDFTKTLTDEQKAALLAALTEDESICPPPTEEDFINKNKVDVVTEDFRVVNNKNNLQRNSRRVPVNAGKNNWSDTGEHKNVKTPDIKKTPRNRKPAVKSTAKCHVCGKSVKFDKRFQYGEFVRCDNCGSKR